MRSSKPELATEYDFEGMRVAIISAKWNAEFNNMMTDSAKNALRQAGLESDYLDTYEVPGAYEIPFFAQELINTDEYDAVICFATIIRGATRHFEIVADESARGLMRIMLDTNVPIINGILACETEEQADQRSNPAKEDKGREMALTLIDMLSELDKLPDAPESEDEDEEELEAEEMTLV